MAYFKITRNSEGKLVAKVQISGKEPGTGKTKLYVKRFYNIDNLSAAKFRKQVDMLAAQLEREINIAYHLVPPFFIQYACACCSISVAVATRLLCNHCSNS